MLNKKILIVSDSLRKGGVQRALIDLLNNFDFGESEVDLLLFNNTKLHEYKLNNKINVLHGSLLLKIINYTSLEAKERGWYIYTIRKFFAALTLIFGSPFIYKLLLLGQKVDKKYDIAISFTNNVNNKSLYFGSNMYVLENVNSKMKITWLHIYPSIENLINEYNYNEYKKFDKIICVSKSVQNKLNQIWPTFKSKTYLVYNFIDTNNINLLSNKSIINLENKFNIVTVARLDKNKSPLSVVETSKILYKNGVSFCWYVIGNGPLRRDLEYEVSKNKLNDYIKIIGETNNPYNYIKQSQLFVSFSKSESYGLAITESLVIGTPVLANYYDALPELIINEFNGIYCEYTEDLFSKIILRLINDKVYYLKIKSNTRILIDNLISSNQLYNIIK